MTMLSTRGFRIASRKESGLEEGRLRWSVMIMSTSSLERCANDDEDDEDDEEESPGEVCQEAGDHLEGEEDEDGHPVEQVGHDGRGEAQSVLVALLDVVEGDYL